MKLYRIHEKDKNKREREREREETSESLKEIRMEKQRRTNGRDRRGKKNHGEKRYSVVPVRVRGASRPHKHRFNGYANGPSVTR